MKKRNFKNPMGAMRKHKDLSGSRFGKLTVIQEADRNKHNQFMWKCKCDCGNELIVNGGSLRQGFTKSCGCIIQDKALAKPEHLRQRDDVPVRCGVYSIANPDGEIYIGSSKHIYKRWIRHRDARKEMNICYSIKKYGWRAHAYNIEHELPLNIPESELIMYEQAYIDFYKAAGFKMMNIKEAGSTGKFPIESRIKMSNSHPRLPAWNKGTKGICVAWNKGLTKKDYPSQKLAT